MALIGNIQSSAIKNELREIIVELYQGYTCVGSQILPCGYDSAPIPSDQGVLVALNNSSKKMVVGTYPKAEAVPGEVRIRSRDLNGNVKALICWRTDGTLEINGNSDFAVRFNALETVIKKLVDDINTELSKKKDEAGSPGSVTVDLSSAKVTEVKLP